MMKKNLHPPGFIPVSGKWSFSGLLPSSKLILRNGNQPFPIGKYIYIHEILQPVVYIYIVSLPESTVAKELLKVVTDS